MQQLIEFFFELFQRLFKQTNPVFFKKLMWAFGGLSSVIIVALGLNTSFGWGWGLILIAKVPLTYILGSLSSMFGGMALMAKLPNPNTPPAEPQ